MSTTLPDSAALNADGRKQKHEQLPPLYEKAVDRALRFADIAMKTEHFARCLGPLDVACCKTVKDLREALDDAILWLEEDNRAQCKAETLTELVRNLRAARGKS